MSSTNGTNAGPILVGGIPIIWMVVLCCSLIVIGSCAMSYPLILLNRWRMKERSKVDEEEEEEEEEEDEESEPERRKGRGPKSIFGRGRASTRGKWVERMDPQTSQPYYEHTGTGEVTWVDPRPAKMRQQKPAPAPGMGGSLVAASMMQHGMHGQAFGAPGGFGAPRPGMPNQGMMMPGGGGPMMAHAGSMGNVLPPQMQGPPRMPPGQPFPGPMGGAPMPPGPGGAPPPPGMVSAGSMRQTQAPAAPAPAQAAPAAPAADPKFEKYSRMQKAGLPEGAIRNAMNRDGLTEAEQKAFLGS